MFDRLRRGDLVRWTNALRDRWYTLPDAYIWEEEPSCALEVTALDNEEETAELECVNCCGGHAVMSLTRDEYENNCLILGDELIEFVNFSDLPEVLGPGSRRFSFANEEESILEMIQGDCLPQ